MEHNIAFVPKQKAKLSLMYRQLRAGNPVGICYLESPNVPVGQRHLGSLSHREGKGNLEQIERSWGDLKARAAGERGGAGPKWAGCVAEASPGDLGWVVGKLHMGEGRTHF